MKRVRYIIAIIIFVAGSTMLSSCGGDTTSEFDSRLDKARLLVKNGNLDSAEAAYQQLINDFNNNEKTVLAKEELAEIYRLQNQLLKAKEIYKEIIRQHPESEDIDVVQKKLFELNIDILTSGLITDNSIVYEVKPGDSLARIASKYNTTIELIMLSNDIESTVIRPGDRLKVVTADFSILVDKSQSTLTLKANDEIIKTYTISTGKDNCTPVGEFVIKTKLENPVHYKDGQVIPSESPENVLGTRWMGFDLPEYGIHGTTDEGSIGSQVTEGCVRMRNREVEELYSIVPRGTEVTIVE